MGKLSWDHGVRVGASIGLLLLWAAPQRLYAWLLPAPAVEQDSAAEAAAPQRESRCAAAPQGPVETPRDAERAERAGGPASTASQPGARPPEARPPAPAVATAPRDAADVPSQLAGSLSRTGPPRV